MGQKGPCASQRSICALRSLPQKGSPSTTKKGAPNTPAAMASSLARFRRAFHCGSFHAASACCASRPLPAASAFSASGWLSRVPRVK